MARPPLLCQGGDFAFPAGCPRRPCPVDDLWVTLKHHCKEGWPSDSENIAKHPLIARPGWFSDESKRKTTPAASASVASPKFSLMTQLPLLAVVLRWCKEGNNALSQLIHSFGVVRSNSKTISLERLFVSTHSAYLFLPEATSTPVSLARSIDDL